MSQINEDKKALRKQIREAKKVINPADKRAWSVLICSQLEELPEYRAAKVVLLYYSMEDEVFTHDLVRRAALNKKVLLPVVNGDELLIRRYEGDEMLAISEGFNISEPLGSDFTDLEKIDLVVVPGIAFDARKNRMGRGKGYYDKFLTSTTSVKVALAFDFQVVESVPADINDIQMDIIITEKQIIL